MAKRNVTVKETQQKGSKSLTNNTTAVSQQRHIEIEDTYNPFPDVEDIERLNQINPTFVAEIFEHIKKEQSFRHTQVNKRNDAVIQESNTNNLTKKLGMIFAFIIFITSMLTSTFLIYNDKTVTGSIFFGATLVSAIALFISGQQSNKSE